MASPTSACALSTPKHARLRSLGGDGGPTVTIPASPFMEKLGCGTGVSVYLLNRPGKLNTSPWAVKKINSKCASKQSAVYQQRLDLEAQVLKGLQHPNIVGFRAVALARDGSQCLAMEFGGEKSLNDLIEARREEGLGPFPAAHIEKVALHVARGLQYLHDHKKLLHGDIKSCNVVIKGNFEAVKICDVGVSLKLDDNMRVSEPGARYVGTEPWRPKETLEEGGEVTDRADIYAYGLTLWEMMTLCMPHLQGLEEEEEEEEEEDFDEDAYYERLGSRPALDSGCLDSSYQKMVELFCMCTEEDATKRPSARRIVQVLEGPAPPETPPPLRSEKRLVGPPWFSSQSVVFSASSFLNQ